MKNRRRRLKLAQNKNILELQKGAKMLASALMKISGIMDDVKC
jgi:hypothetical protein